MYRFPVGKRVLNVVEPGKDLQNYKQIKVKPLAATLGAEISGADLSSPLNDAVFAEIDAAFQERKVIVFRNQKLSKEQFLGFAQRWGTIVEDSLGRQVAGKGNVIPMPNAVDNVAVFTRDKYTQGLENIWHVDGSYRINPVLGTMLCAVDVPPLGADTMFADMAAAYDNLDETLRAKIDDKWAWHDWSVGGYSNKYADKIDEYRAVVPPVRHPVVKRHPRTGRKTLFVNRGFSTEIIGLDPVENDQILDILTRQADVPEYQFRMQWEPGLVVFWDNHAVQHYAVNDFWPQSRTLMRATVDGPWKTGVNMERATQGKAVNG